MESIFLIALIMAVGILVMLAGTALAMFVHKNKKVNVTTDNVVNGIERAIYKLTIYSGGNVIYDNRVHTPTYHLASVSVTEVDTDRRIWVNGDFVLKQE